ncbi:unnamed protein product [Blepharisma stoltei]|uniref:NECAP PHear domain-containing protein n=1 Tax=Blepharisma stoltei TaxID=1481888 RepID=A0AAU9IV58_9CILI|nr:unnamed protein product [Blepharisma stoltei]
MDLLDDTIEYTLVQKPMCRAYEIPPSARSTGHMAAEWKNCIFQGKVRVIASENKCAIQLITNDNQLFVSCPVDPHAVERSVERATDSSRYFVLRVVGPNGAHAFIGMGFDERNDAFDFWAALVDFSGQIKNEEQAVLHQSSPGPDLSHLQLGQGQSISLSGASTNKTVTNSQPKPLPRLAKPPQ